MIAADGIHHGETARRGIAFRWLLSGFLLAAPLVEPQADQIISIAYLKEGMSELNDSDKLVGLQMWAEEMTGLTHMRTEVTGVNTMHELMRGLESKSVNFALFNTGAYLGNYRILKPYLANEILGVQRSEQLFEDYLILVKNSSPIHDFRDLRNRRLAISKEHILYNDYLEYLVKKISGKQAAYFFKKIDDAPTPSRAVLEVFFGGSDACLAPRHIFELTAALNPQVSKDLRIIHSSGAIFIPAVLVAFNSEPEETRKLIVRAMLDVQLTLRGKQILELFKIKGLVPAAAEDFTPMFKIYE
ncbi:MAG: PhnD/SsuA/transferrin family substrate-binding protein [Methylomonas sp.]|jgi:ABC-type phosphate/phosphonate transport system substrate-binding protein